MDRVKPTLEEALAAKSLIRGQHRETDWFRGVLLSLTDEGYHIRLQVDNRWLKRSKSDLREWYQGRVPVMLEGV